MVTEGAQENTFPEKRVLCPVCRTHDRARPRDRSLARCVSRRLSPQSRVSRVAEPRPTRPGKALTETSLVFPRLQRINSQEMRVSLRVEDAIVNARQRAKLKVSECRYDFNWRSLY